MEGFTALQLLLLLTLGAISSGNARPLGRQKRQAQLWTVSERSECTATCDAGIRTRSVRCLDEDAVIVRDCSHDSRPESYQFCNQVDCNTGVPLSDTLPPSGNYTLVNGDDSISTVEFDNQGDGYEIEKSTTESDGTISSLSAIATPTTFISTTGVRGRKYTLGLRSIEGVISFNVDGNNLISLNGVQTMIINSGETISYSDNSLTLSGSGVQLQNVSTFYYFDGFLFYPFRGSKINALTGQGKLYTNMGIALYSTDVSLNAQLDGLISTAPPPPSTNPPPIPTEPSPTTSTPESSSQIPQTPSVTTPTEGPLRPLRPEPSPEFEGSRSKSTPRQPEDEDGSRHVRPSPRPDEQTRAGKKPGQGQEEQFPRVRPSKNGDRPRERVSPTSASEGEDFETGRRRPGDSARPRPDQHEHSNKRGPSSGPEDREQSPQFSPSPDNGRKRGPRPGHDDVRQETSAASETSKSRSECGHRCGRGRH